MNRTLTRRLILAYVRYYLGVSRLGAPLRVVDGFGPPAKVGTGYYHVNKRGDVIDHPNAYRRKFGRPIYVPSTRRVEVGAGWLLARHLIGLAEDAPWYAVRDRLDDCDLVRREARGPGGPGRTRPVR